MIQALDSKPSSFKGVPLMHKKLPEKKLSILIDRESGSRFKTVGTAVLIFLII